MAETVAGKQASEARALAPPGTTGLLILLDRLIRRPRRGDQRLPLIWLVGAAARDALAAVTRRIGSAPRRRVPHAVVTATDFPAADGVRRLLDEVYQQLSLEAFGAERFRFRHYPLARWLMDQTLPGVEGDDRRAVEVDDRRARLVERLRARGRRWSEPDGKGGGTDTVFAAVYQFVVWLVRRAVPGVLFRAAVSGRTPLIGGHYRWFMRQQYLAPRQSTTFVGFAERLTTGWRNDEQPDQVNKLLVHAFLEDLRRAHQRRPWRLAGWRRTAYPVLLVDDVRIDNAGHTLLRLINDVRNETGRGDPLLVVGASVELPDGATGRAREYRLDRADEAGGRWLEDLSERRRRRRPDAWYLLLRTDPAEDGPYPHGAAPELVAPAPPWWARRVVAAGLVLALLAGALVWAGTRWGPGCLPRPLRGHVAVQLVERECVGYSDQAAQIFNSDPGQESLRGIQRRIFAQNREVEQVWESSGRRRPLMTLVWFGVLTGQRTGPKETAYVSEREELEGMAVAQYSRMKASASTDGQALLRIVIANGGRQMRHAEQVTELLAELAGDDPSVVGVVGLVDSRTSTARVLRRLNALGLPAVAPTLGADGMYRNSRLYLQMVAPNEELVSTVASYAKRQLKVREAHVYWTAGDDAGIDDDLYVKTLVDDLRRRYGEQAVRQFQIGDDLAGECGYAGLLLFAGRYSEFDEFLEALRGCGNRPPRHLVADDSVNRYMANAQLRASAPGNVPVTYVSKAALASCARLRAEAPTDEVRRRFLDLLGRPDLLAPPRCGTGDNPPVGERVGLAYDATVMLIQAVEQLAGRLAGSQHPWEPRSISPLAVYTEVLRRNAGGAYPGVTGPVRFADTGVPVGKRLSLMQVTRVPDVGTAPREIWSCEADPATGRSRCGVP